MWHKLLQYLQKMPRISIAFSGGLDSRFLAYAAKKANCQVLLLHASGVHIQTQESFYAQTWAKENGIDIKNISMDVLSLDAVKNNSKQRCYYCKKHLFDVFKPLAAGTLCDGTNADDMKNHRPGLKALSEHNILSPLAACGLSKQNIRELAAKFGLDNAEQKARPCLLTRLDYNYAVTSATLERIAAAEFELEQAGLSDFRLRLCNEPILQSVEHDLPVKIISEILEKHGFFDVKIYVSENISGFYDLPK